MKLKNRFYKNPKLYEVVLEHAQKVYVIPRAYCGREYMIERVYKLEEGHYYLGLPPTPHNTESCINNWVDHCIITYMLEHPEEEYIDTDFCEVGTTSMPWDLMRKIILYGEQSPDYQIRSLKYVDDMIELVNLILRTLNL